MSPSFTSSRFLNWLLAAGTAPTDTAYLRQLKRLFVGTLWGVLLGVSILALFFLAQGILLVALTFFLAVVVSLCLFISIYLRPRLFFACVHTACFFLLLLALSITLFFGGISASGGALLWGFLAPICALGIVGQRAGKFWLGAFFITVILGGVLPNWIPARYTLPMPNIATSTNYLIMGLLIFFPLAYFVRQRDEFQHKSDDLLRNILPAEIAERMKDHSTFIAEYFDHASVLFADVVEFTPMSARMSPAELVALLNEVFSEFDLLVEKHNLEKIKTIGDCYMVAAGVPRPRPDHAHALAQLALEFQALVMNRGFYGHRLRFRIGLNSGPLVAGVIGRHKFIYDLWGDTVNMASRMESHGSAGFIQITEATYELIKDDFCCEKQGAIDVKGKGEMKVWYVLGKKA